MAEVDEYGHYYRAIGCDKPEGSHGFKCVTTEEVRKLKAVGWQVTPAPVPECKTCGDTGSFEVDGHDYPCLSCGRGKGVSPEARDKYKAALEEIRLHHKTYQSIRSNGNLYCDLCAARWPCKTFRMANDVLGCNHWLLGPHSCAHCGKALE